MSDPFFDSLRDSGEYPPKGFYEMSDERREKIIRREQEDGNHSSWVILEHMRLVSSKRVITDKDISELEERINKQDKEFQLETDLKRPTVEDLNYEYRY